MPEREYTTMSLTELPQFGRLVEFVGWAHAYAEETDDYALAAAIEELTDDLRQMAPKIGDV